MKRTGSARHKAQGARLFFLCALSFALCPAILAQEAATQGWSAAQSRQRSLNALSLVVTGDRPNVMRSGAEAFSVAVNRNEREEGPRTPFPVLIPKVIVYPRKAVRKGWEGQTIVAAEVLPDGSVGKTLLAKSSGHEILDHAARSAIKDWKFANENENGGTVPQFVDIPVTFKIQKED